MRLFSHVMRASVCLLLLALSGAYAKVVFVMAPEGSGQVVSILDENLDLLGSFPSPPQGFAAFGNPSGTKYFVVSRSSDATITTVLATNLNVAAKTVEGWT